MGSVTVVTPARRRSLTTAERYRDTHPDIELDDVELERLISRCSGMVERYCKRSFARERVVERETGDGLAVILLSRTPVITFHGLTTGSTIIDVSRYHLTPAAGILQLDVSTIDPNYMWHALGGPQLYDTHRELITYAAEYEGGYIVPGDPDYPLQDDEDALAFEQYLPFELEHACHLILRSLLEQRERPMGLQSERLGDAAWTYAKEGGSSVGAAAGILDTYKRVVL